MELYLFAVKHFVIKHTVGSDITLKINLSAVNAL